MAEVGAKTHDQLGVVRNPCRATGGCGGVLHCSERVIDADVHDARTVRLDEVLRDRVIARVRGKKITRSASASARRVSRR